MCRACFWCAGMLAAAVAMPLHAGEVTPYRLLPESAAAIKFCAPPCACPSREEFGPLVGFFDLELTLSEPPTLEEYAVRRVDFVVRLPSGDVTLRGSGVYQLIGDFTTTHRLTLTLRVLGADGVTFESGTPIVDFEHYFPEIDIQTQSQNLGCHEIVLTVRAAPDECPADVNGDNRVDLADLAVMLGSFGTGSGATRTTGDLDGDADVDLADLARLLGRFGESCG